MKIPTCHPERKHLAKGMCSQCYWAWRWRNDTEFRERRIAYGRTYRAEVKADPVCSAALREYYRAKNRESYWRRKGVPQPEVSSPSRP